LAGAAVLGPFGGAWHAEAAGGGRNDVSIAEPKDGIPSATATDWVSYEDQAPVVHVAAEHEGAADSEEVAAGEGYLSRTVDLQVKERVWSRSGATALPAALTIVADGWSFKGDAKTRVGSAEASRLEVGHDYLVALAHYADGEWATIGTGAILPYDGGEVGQGEYEASTVTATAYRAKMQAKLVTGAEEPLAYRASTSAASQRQDVPDERDAGRHCCRELQPRRGRPGQVGRQGRGDGSGGRRHVLQCGGPARHRRREHVHPRGTGGPRHRPRRPHGRLR
jgi:hypothetical protein